MINAVAVTTASIGSPASAKINPLTGTIYIIVKNVVKPAEELTVSEIKPKGSILVFPSFLWHKVVPVTKGVRQSLVVWFGGKPFR